MSRSINGALGPMELKALSTGHETDRNRLSEWRGLVVRALGKSSTSQKRGAADLGITEGQFSRQLSGAEHLSFWRMESLPIEFWQELLELIADFKGISLSGTKQDAEDAAIGRLVREAVTRCR